MTAPEEPGMGPIIRDNRRIDPVTGQPRRGKHAASQPAGTSGAGRPGGPGSSRQHVKAGENASTPEEEVSPTEGGATTTAGPAAASPTTDSAAASKLQSQLAERTADLQRLQAEYANYRKRVDRDRVTVREHAVAGTLSELLPVLDAIGQAREHGELSGGFKSVADSLQAAVSKLGLVSYGQRGDAFDPKIHEALTHTYSPDVDEDTCVEIFQPGYKVGERILRPARVAVAAPATAPDDGGEAAEWPSGDL
ncbi:MAG: nucleotide exchange factor GrpE [Trebonia sp.]|uniref:nucleotide exchange factor GrpE n=1 Tax=Trebonia sp. TaxID=2767075 RepID=UPI003C793F3A